MSIMDKPAEAPQPPKKSAQMLQLENYVPEECFFNLVL
jgi:hypothetical protein